MYSRLPLRIQPIWRARLAPLVALGLAGLFSPSVTPLTASQQPETSPQPAHRERVEQFSQRATDRALALQAEADELAASERVLLDEIRRREVDRQIRTADVEARLVELYKLGRASYTRLLFSGADLTPDRRSSCRSGRMV